jgi:hypothetical protein
MEGDRLENHVREIVIELIVCGEQSYRDNLLHQHEWRVQRKAQLDEDERKRVLQVERQRKEEQTRLEQQRIEHLLSQADALHKAQLIRAYVAAVQKAETEAEQTSSEELKAWSAWALAQADRIDPVLNCAYKTRPPEPKI